MSNSYHLSKVEIQLLRYVVLYGPSKIESISNRFYISEKVVMVLLDKLVYHKYIELWDRKDGKRRFGFVPSHRRKDIEHGHPTGCETNLDGDVEQEPEDC